MSRPSGFWPAIQTTWKDRLFWTPTYCQVKCPSCQCQCQRPVPTPIGPNKPAAAPVDAWTFLMLCRTRFPKAIISIGWTTNVDTSVKSGYTRDMVDHMASLVKEYNLMQPVTFAVNATLLKYSICELQRLLFQVLVSQTITHCKLAHSLVSGDLRVTLRCRTALSPYGLIRMSSSRVSIFTTWFWFANRFRWALSSTTCPQKCWTNWESKSIPTTEPMPMHITLASVRTDSPVVSTPPDLSPN